MDTPIMGRLLLLSTGNTPYESDICVTLLQSALSAGCVGNEDKFHSLIQMIVEMRLWGVIDDLADYEAWSRSDIKLGEAICTVFEKNAVRALTKMLTPNENDDISEMRCNLNSVYLFLWRLPEQAFDYIKHAVTFRRTTISLPQAPRPGDIA